MKQFTTIGFLLVVMMNGQEREMAFSSSQRSLFNHKVRHGLGEASIRPVRKEIK